MKVGIGEERREAVRAGRGYEQKGTVTQKWMDREEGTGPAGRGKACTYPAPLPGFLRAPSSEPSRALFIAKAERWWQGEDDDAVCCRSPLVNSEGRFFLNRLF